MDKHGVLIVNGFLTGNKYSQVYEYLTRAFERCGADISVIKNTELSNKVGDSSIIDKSKTDFALVFDKDIRLCSAIERAGIRCFNRSSAIKACDDKIETYLALEKSGVPFPETYIAPKTFSNIGYTDASFLREAGEKLGYPFVIKEAFGSFGKQVYLANDLLEAERIVKGIKGDFLMQKFIKESRGKDVRINVVGDRAVASILRVNENDFRSNVTGGGKAYPYEPTEKETSVAIAAARALGCDFCGVDVLFGNDGPIVCEVNASMHFVSTYEATGINVADDIAEYVLNNI